MYELTTTRAALPDVLANKRSATASFIRGPGALLSLSLDAQSVAVVWEDNPVDDFDFPILLITADGRERDWIAWLATYVPQFRPFTAYCRVIDRKTAAVLLGPSAPPALGPMANSYLGLIFGELMSSEEAIARVRSEPLTVSSCASTLSFVLARAAAIRSTTDPSELAERWALVRQLTRQRGRPLPPRDVLRVAGILAALVSEARGEAAGRALHSPIFRAVKDVAENGEIGSSVRSLKFFDSMPAGTLDAMRGTREARVTTFEQIVDIVTQRDADVSEDDAFLLGYFASQIAPGSLMHAPVVGPLLARFPTAMLWYGVCAGLYQDTSVATEFGGAGRRVLRDLLSPDANVGRPRADLGSLELEVLVSGDRPIDHFATASPSQLVVELAPGVTTVVNWSRAGRGRSATGQDSQQIGRDERQALAGELGNVVLRLSELYYGLTGDSAPESRKGEQRTLFEPPPDKRGRRR